MEDYVNKLAQQIANQRKNLGTDKYYKGDIGSMGGIDNATQYMASLLNRSGVRDLSEIGERIERAPEVNANADPNQAFTDFNNWYRSDAFQGQSAGATVDINGKKYVYANISNVDPAKLSGSSLEAWYRQVGDPYREDLGGITYPALLPIENIGPEQKVLYNKRTGEQLKQGNDASYAYANTALQTNETGKYPDAYIFGGSFAGGNTNLNITMVDGMPIFSSSPGPSSSAISKEGIAMGLTIASLAFPGLGTAIGGSITGALGIGASAAVNAAIGTGVLTTLASGGDVKKGVISGLTAFVAPQIANEIGNAAGGIFDSPVGQKMFASMSASALRVAALGGSSEDISKAVMGAATGEMFNVITSQIPGFGDIKDPATKAAISSSVQAALNTPGDLSEKAQAAMLQGSITMGLSELEVDGKKFNQLPPAQQSIARQALTSALTGQPLNERAILNTALSAASKEVQNAIKTEQKTGVEPDLAAYDASVGLTQPATPFADDVGFALGTEFTVPGAAPPDNVLTADVQAAGPLPSGLPVTEPRERVAFASGMGGVTDILSPTGGIAQLGGDVLGQEITAPDFFRQPFTEYASAATSDVPAQDISISQLPETMRPREGETVTDATYGPEGEVRVTMVGKRPDGTEYSYTAVQDPEDKSVFYETASGDEAGGATRISDTRPGVEEKPADNVVIEGEDGSTVTLDPNGAVVGVTDSDGTLPDNASDIQDVVDRVIANPVDTTESQEIPLTESQKIAAGFPSAAIYDLYSGDVARYQQDEADYAGFPDWKTYTEYAGDSKAYQDDLAVAEGWPDAATRDEFGTKERYAQHLADERDLLERGRLYDLEQAAIKAGFPDYATQQKFEGDYDAYVKSLLPPQAEPAVETVEGGTDTTQGAVGVDTLDGGIGEDTAQGAASDDATGETKAGNIVITGEDGSTVTLSPDGSVVDATDPDGSTSSDVQDVLDRVIANPVNIDTLEGAPGNNTFVGGEGNDTFVGDGEDTVDGGVATTEGGEGNDTLTGAVGNDTFTAGGDDSLGGETDEDILDKLFGDDTFVGGEGNDTVTYNDTLEGGEGNDTLEGGAGNDTVTGVATLEGGSGNDSLGVDEQVTPEEIVPTCPEGFVYDYELGACVPEVTEPPKPEVIECEDGYIYDPVQGICVPETIVTPPVVTPPVVTPPQPPQPPPPPSPPPPPPRPQTGGQDWLGLLGMLGMLQNQKRQQPPQAPAKEPEEYTYWEQLGSPYSPDEQMTTDDLIKMLRG